MGEASQAERVRQHQLAVAKSMGLPPAVLEVLGKVEDWKLREWLYICALDGFPAERIGECARGGTDVAALCRIREEFWQKRCARTDDLRKDVESLGREVRQASQESRAAREAVEEAMKKKEREHAEELKAKESAIRLLKSQVGRLEEELGRWKEGEVNGDEVKRDEVKTSGSGSVPEPKNVMGTASGEQASPTPFPRALMERFLARRKEGETKKFIETFVKDGKLRAEQVEFLMECLEEGVSVREMERFTAPGISVDMMRRLKELHKKGG